MKTILFLVLVLFFSCRKRDTTPKETVLGSVSVDLDANLTVVRKKEALIGNFICDAIQKYITDKGKTIDGVFLNGGNIRFDAQNRPNGIYPAGNITDKIATEMLPFGDVSVIVKLTGKQIKSILERSVALYPQAKGPFLQFSKNIQITIDTLKNPQLLSADETQIVTQGNRITSVSFNGALLDSFKIYSIVFPIYIADGNDGYLTLKNTSSSNKETLEEDQVTAVKELLINQGVVTPVLENRIVFQ